MRIKDFTATKVRLLISSLRRRLILLRTYSAMRNRIRLMYELDSIEKDYGLRVARTQRIMCETFNFNCLSDFERMMDFRFRGT